MASPRRPGARPRGRGRTGILTLLVLLAAVAPLPAAALAQTGGEPGVLLEPGPGQVALTFDDGPAAPYTAEILDILERYGVPATFFVSGRQAAAHPEYLRRMEEGGHSVQSHAWDHDWLTRYSNTTITGLLRRAQEAITAATGRPPACLRPPFGAVSPRVRTVAAGLGLATVMWAVDPWDWKRPGARVVAAHVLRHTRGGDVVLLHDTAGRSTVDALPEIIEGLRARGLELVPLCSSPGRALRQAGEDRLL